MADKCVGNNTHILFHIDLSKVKEKALPEFEKLRNYIVVHP